MTNIALVIGIPTSGRESNTTMKDKWYADNRDLIKWSVLINLAQNHQAKRILQIAYFRPCEFSNIEIEDRLLKLPKEVISHFRDIRNITEMRTDFHIDVLYEEFKDREKYQKAIVEYISSYPEEKCIVFLDPDTGLQPQKSKLGLEHVSNGEVREIWEHIKKGDIFVFYQHQTNRNGRPWVDEKREQLSKAANIPVESVKIAHGRSIAKDVVFFYAVKA